jgi:NarL family two-component system sensor histidine kinase YdfH
MLAYLAPKRKVDLTNDSVYRNVPVVRGAMRQIITLPTKFQSTYYIRPFLVVLTLSAFAQYLWWVVALASGHYGVDPNAGSKVLIGGGLWALHLLLYWATPSLTQRRWGTLPYICTQCLVGIAMNYVTAPFFLGFNMYIILIGQALGIFQNVPLALLAFGLSLFSKEITNYFYYAEVYHATPNVLSIALTSIFASDILHILINIPFVASIYLQYRARSRTQSLLQELDVAHRELASYAAQVKELTLAAERERMARELHDTLAQGLTGVSLQLEALDAYLEQGQPEKAKAIIAQMKQRTKTALASSRTAIQDLRALPASEKPLLLLIQEMVEQFMATTGITGSLESPMLATMRPAALPDMTATHILRCLSESLNNIHKHADATQVTVRVAQTDDAFDLYVTDNGVGFELEAGLNKHGHYGLLGLQERARLMGGTVDIESAPNEGTKIHFHLDLAPLRVLA